MANPRCRVCSAALKALPQGHEPLCSKCIASLGLVALPPPRRPPNACTRCGGFKFVRAMLRQVRITATTGLTSVTSVNQHLSPAGVTWAIEASTEMLGLAVIPGSKPAIDKPHGLLSLYICSGCGFSETYCEDPASIPIGPEYMTDVVDYTAMQR